MALQLFFTGGGFGPFIGAIFLTSFAEGKDGIKKLLKKGIHHKFRKIWFVPIFLFFPLLYGLVSLFGVITGFTLDLLWLSNPLILVFGFLFLFVINSTAEEFGWRGYALEKTKIGSSALRAFIFLI